MQAFDPILGDTMFADKGYTPNSNPNQAQLAPVRSASKSGGGAPPAQEMSVMPPQMTGAQALPQGTGAQAPAPIRPSETFYGQGGIASKQPNWQALFPAPVHQAAQQAYHQAGQQAAYGVYAQHAASQAPGQMGNPPQQPAYGSVIGGVARRVNTSGSTSKSKPPASRNRGASGNARPPNPVENINFQGMQAPTQYNAPATVNPYQKHGPMPASESVKHGGGAPYGFFESLGNYGYSYGGPNTALSRNYSQHPIQTGGMRPRESDPTPNAIPGSPGYYPWAGPRIIPPPGR